MAFNDNNNSYGAGADKPKPKLSKTVSEKLGRSMDVASTGFQKTKVVASAGFEKSKVAAVKVKEGTSAGINWIKLKYNKSKLFQKK